MGPNRKTSIKHEIKKIHTNQPEDLEQACRTDLGVLPPGVTPPG